MAAVLAKPVIAVTISSQELRRFVHWQNIFDGLQQFGAIVLAVECGSAPQHTSSLLANVDGLIISGGGDVDPALHGADRRDPLVKGVNTIRDGNEIAAFESAWRRGIPTLAICRGAQLVNAARGGTLYLDLRRDHPSSIEHWRTEEQLIDVSHRVDVVAGSRVAGWLGQHGPISVNSQHHQGIRELAPAFVATATADDGLVEAYEATGQAVTGVQWHPEVNWPRDELAQRLLRGFIESCRPPAVDDPSEGLSVAPVRQDLH
jgi:putative glutamine amidotransferase